ncbi:MAG: GreA/GreB family elongation factor [Myxococcota bacterium]|nr:GreA/GreB family elongation factor [Myxococcota bacterium]
MPTKRTTDAPPLPDKGAVRDALIAVMQSALAAIAHSAKDAAAGATHAENRSEGSKDMRATEQSYIARGQAMRAEELAEQIQRLAGVELRSFGARDAIAPAALVRVMVDGAPRVFFVVPWGGGHDLEVGGTKVMVITPASPVGRALVGRSVGDEFELAVKGAMREWEIDAIA